MLYLHKVILNHPRTMMYKFSSEAPYIPADGDAVCFPEGWKRGTRFRVVGVHHYLADRLVIIEVAKEKEET